MARGPYINYYLTYPHLCTSLLESGQRVGPGALSLSLTFLCFTVNVLALAQFRTLGAVGCLSRCCIRLDRVGWACLLMRSSAFLSACARFWVYCAVRFAANLCRVYAGCFAARLDHNT